MVFRIKYYFGQSHAPARHMVKTCFLETTEASIVGNRTMASRRIWRKGRTVENLT